MGCDIHIVIEGIRYNDKWSCLLDGICNHLPRNYYMFAALAGVRAAVGSPPPIAELRGYPVDATYPVTGETIVEDGNVIDWTLQCTDFHSRSWLSYQEIKDAAESGRYQKAANLPALVKLIEAVAELHSVPVEKTRLVFAFDN